MVSTELGESAFSFLAPYLWNNLQNVLKCDVLVTLGKFREQIEDLIAEERLCFLLPCCSFCLHLVFIMRCVFSVFQGSSVK
jgi:hypothetical protein